MSNLERWLPIPGYEGLRIKHVMGHIGTGSPDESLSIAKILEHYGAASGELPEGGGWRSMRCPFPR